MTGEHFALTESGGTPVVRVIGDVDFSNRAEFEALLAQASPSAPLIVSFLDCSFCDSSIIGALMKLRNTRPDAEIRLAVAPNTAVWRVFELVGVDRVFPVDPGNAAAIA